MSSEFDDLKESGAGVVTETEEVAGAKAAPADDWEVPVTEEDLEACKFPANVWTNVRIDKAFKGFGKESKQPLINWRLVATQEPYIGQSVLYTTSLQKHALFSLNNLFEAVRFKPVRGWKPKDLYSFELEVIAEPGTYNGKAVINVKGMRPKAML